MRTTVLHEKSKDDLLIANLDRDYNLVDKFAIRPPAGAGPIKSIVITKAEDGYQPIRNIVVEFYEP